MIFTTLASLIALPAVLAQYGGPPAGGSSSTSTAAAAAPSAPANTTGHINVDVFVNGTYRFSPANITAPVGTLVTFFFPGGSIPHSVTQGSFADPCTYLVANSSAGTGAGFDSGLTNSVQFTINITNTDPIWYHCKEVGHCGMGMVGSINAPTNGSTFEAYQAAAMKIGSSEVAQTSGGAITGGVNGIATATPAATFSATSSSGSSSSSTRNIASLVAVLISIAAIVVMV
jgi:plastocyanin